MLADDDNEEDRLEALRRIGVLDTAPQRIFDDLVAAAAEVAGTPTALLSLVDKERQWFKARVGFPRSETSRREAFCDHVVRSNAELIVEDALADERFVDHPLVVGPPHVRFYAGFPLRANGAYVIGTLCVLGPEPMRLGAAQLTALRALAGQTIGQIELGASLLREHQARIAQERAAGEASIAQRFLTRLLETIPVAVVACDADGRLTMFNAAAQHFHGLDADPTMSTGDWVLAYSLFDADGSTELPIRDVPLLRALRGEMIIGEHLVIAPEGLPRRTVRCDGGQLRDETGTVTGAVIAMSDVTAELDAHLALRSAHDALRSALDAMPRQISLLGVERDAGGDPVRLRLNWINAEVERTTGFALAELAGRTLDDAFPYVAQHLGREYLEVARTGQPFKRLIDGFDGDYLQASLAVTAVPWVSDGVLVDVEDVTSRRNAELALDDSRRRLELAQDQAGIATWSWDLGSGAVTWSPRLRDLFDADEDIRPSFERMLDMVHPDDRREFTSAYDRLLADGRSISLDHRIVAVDGAIRWVRAWASVELDRNGRPLRVDGSKQEITLDRRREQLLSDEAAHDPLTGVLNRRGWAERADRVVGDARRAGDVVNVVLLDIDHFKRVNDRDGHEAGDRVLCQCADAWTRCLRAGDLLARWGGEEFALLLPNCSLDEAEALVERLRAQVPAPITASAGVASLARDEALDAAVARADAALYEAKTSGRDCVRVAPPRPADPDRPRSSDQAPRTAPHATPPSDPQAQARSRRST